MPLHVTWCCLSFRTLMGQYWNITLSKALMLLLHRTLKYWNQSWSCQFATRTFIFSPRWFLCSTIRASAFRGSYH
jgi:hypothetical protein